jgi:hypothetical protein
MEETPTLFNDILSPPVLLQFTNMQTYTMLLLDCESSYTFLLNIETCRSASLKFYILSSALMALM